MCINDKPGDGICGHSNAEGGCDFPGGGASLPDEFSACYLPVIEKLMECGYHFKDDSECDPLTCITRKRITYLGFY